MNWVDILLGLILLLSVIGGFRKGLARTGIGAAAVVVGIVCGLWFYGTAGAFFQRFISSRPFANLAGFLTIFLAAVLLGGLISAILDRLLKFVHLSWLNRLLGAAFGLLRGALICAALMLLVLAFWTKPPGAVARSRIAPYVLGAARVMAYAAPHDVRAGFHRSYDKVKRFWAEAFDDKKPQKAQTDDL